MTAPGGLQTPSTGTIAHDWDVALRRGFPCAGRVVWITLAEMRGDDDLLRFRIEWAPSKPERMLPADVAQFEAFLRQAKAEITKAYEARIGKPR